MASKSSQVWAVVLVSGFLGQAAALGCQVSGAEKGVSPEQAKLFEVMKAKGVEASVTVFPVVIGGQALKDAGNVLGLLLEKGGMSKLDAADVTFLPPTKASLAEAANLFGQLVKETPLTTEYALYAEIVGTPQTGPTEIRSVVVDRTGQCVWSEVQTAADREFKLAKPDCPMDCCVFVATRIQTVLEIPKSARDDTEQGRFARMVAEDSPVPKKAEWDAMEQRQAVMKKSGQTVTVAVYPVRLSDDKVSQEDAGRLAELLDDAKLCDGLAVDSPLRVKIEPARNEQKLLWGLARAFQEHVRKNPPDADYALLADYAFEPRSGKAWTVHFVVCDRAGDWVIVDFQNNHHGDFQSIAPKNSEDCGRLVARRIAGYLH